MRRLLVEQKNIQRVRMEDVPQVALTDGQARLAVDHFALTANNVTYAACGFDIGYWKFFPSGIDGQGIVPVWGVAKVVESRSADLTEGQRLYGFYPMAEELVIVPKVAPGGIGDASPHREGLPAIYNLYMPVKPADPAQDHMRALLQPLLATSWLLFDWLGDNDWFGAEQIIIGSASSKTGLGLCKFLAEPAERPYRIVGLTSERNRAFVEGLGACDQVLGYDAVDRLAQVPSVYVDMAGNGEVKAALHTRLDGHLKHSAAVGLSHWDKFQPQLLLAGIKPKFFFAPAQAGKRSEEWGQAKVQQEIGAAWKRIAAEASGWMTLQEHEGLDSAPAVYAALADGSADPRDGQIVTL